MNCCKSNVKTTCINAFGCDDSRWLHSYTDDTLNMYLHLKPRSGKTNLQLGTNTKRTYRKKIKARNDQEIEQSENNLTQTPRWEKENLSY